MAARVSWKEVITSIMSSETVSKTTRVGTTPPALYARAPSFPSEKHAEKQKTGEALENGDIERVARNEMFLQMLRELSAEKIDFATAYLLSHWDICSEGDEVMVAHVSLP